LTTISALDDRLSFTTAGGASRVPIVVPPFTQYQAPLVPLRGLWRHEPPEGDRFVSCEIDWGITSGPYNCVQFALSGNSPVALSQIVALNVDNSRNGSEVQFLFPDSAAVLVVPPFCQGLYPVFTNALTFYLTSSLASVGDSTVFQILNTIPPPVAVQSSQQQSFTSAGDISVAEVGITVLVPAPTTGTLQSFSLIATAPDAPAGPQAAQIQLQDGTGRILWTGYMFWNAGSMASVPIDVSGLQQRFYQGLYLNVTSTNIVGGVASFTAYYSEP
jgi:hypothetical protein